MNNTSMKTKTLACLLGLAFAAIAPIASAHISVANLVTPYAVANKTYQLILGLNHGCELETGATLDTYKFEVEIPAGFTKARPLLDGVFGRPVITRGADGNATKFVWTRSAAFPTAEDDQAYRIGIQGLPADAPFTTIQFNAKHYCKNPVPGGPDIVLDWANLPVGDGTFVNQSPTVKIYPARSPGWNKYNLATSNEKNTAADVKAFLTSYFADAQIVWVGKGAFSANSIVAAKIKALATKDATYSDLSTKTDAKIKATDDIMVKY